MENVPFAVGTTIADRPPHRSVRAELPHTAPTSDEWRQGATWRTPLDPWTLVPRSVSGSCRVPRRSPLSAPFPPPPPPRRRPLCSAASVVLWRSQTPPWRTRPACGYSPSRTGLLAQTPRRSPGSRAYCFWACLGSSTTPGPAMARDLSPSAGMAFPLTEKGRRPVLSFRSSIAQPTDASVYASPAASRRPAQDSRSGWSRFSFPVGLFHPLQHAGLSRRTPSPGFPRVTFRPLVSVSLVEPGFRLPAQLNPAPCGRLAGLRCSLTTRPLSCGVIPRQEPPSLNGPQEPAPPTAQICSTAPIPVSRNFRDCCPAAQGLAPKKTRCYYYFPTGVKEDLQCAPSKPRF